MDGITYTFNLTNVTYTVAQYDIAAIASEPQRFYDVSRPPNLIASSI
jgi:hypothetical protein